MPWRNTKDPYPIWLSEVILQQTRIAQGLPYYLRFLQAFPTVNDLAEASEEQVLKQWQGLGYYSRARNLHATAKHVAHELQGEFPSTYLDLKKLKGVGDYTASAIASICHGEAKAVVDGNVYRVLARFFGDDTPINTSKGVKRFKELAETVMDREEPATYNQAIMEFGAIQCKPQQPLCHSCPLSEGCLARQQKTIARLPVKLKKQKIRKRHFNYLVILSADGNTVLKKRQTKGIWQHLYEFPLIESEQRLDQRQLEENPELLRLAPNLKKIWLYNTDEVIHKLSHQHLHTQFWIVEVGELQEEGVPKAQVKEYPTPVLIQNFVAEFDL